jgi:hypothetical protein
MIGKFDTRREVIDLRFSKKTPNVSDAAHFEARIRIPRRFLIVGIAIAMIAAMVFVSLYRVPVGRADIYHLYAATCLGGWENTHLAQGAPEARAQGEDGNIIGFTKENSARLNANTHSQIYCGGFTGDILENTVPKKIRVKFSWTALYQTDAPAAPEAGENIENIEAILENLFTPTPTPIPTPDYVPTPAPVSDPTPIPGTTPTLTPAVEPENITPLPEGPVSLLNWFIPIARSQEVAGEIINPTGELPDAAAPSVDTAIITPDIIPAVSPELIAPESAAPESAAPELTAPELTAPPAPGGLVEVSYTLDGIEWKSLGFVAKDAFANAYFEIPIEEASDWEGISKIQISVQRALSIDAVIPVIYLDAIWLEVEYQKLQEGGEILPEPPLDLTEGLQDGLPENLPEDLPEEDLSADLPAEEEILTEEEGLPEEIVYLPPERILSPMAPLIERMLDRDFEIAEGAEHYCDAEIFKIDISGRASVPVRILLGGERIKSGEIEIGSLPLGIDILFSQNRDHLRGVSERDSALDLEIINQEGSQKGNFSIPIIFTDKERNQTTVCQMNIINF